MTQITFERIQELEADVRRATEWADMRTEEVARLQARLVELGETPAAIEKALATPRPPGAKPCPRCEGCRQIANSDDGEPWTAWTSLPMESQLAVRLGFVQPIPCPDCSTTPGARELLDAYASGPYLDGAGGSQTREECAPALARALRAVLDVHQPEPGQHPDFCGACLRQMPCPTVTAITDALEAP